MLTRREIETSPLLDSSRMFNAKILAAIFLVHFTGDFYQSFFQPLFPVIKERFALSLTQIGLLASVVTVSSFVTQPLMGLLADRYQPRRFMIAGLLFSIIFIPLLGVTPWFGLLVLFTAVGALGSSMYHPTAAGMVADHAGDRAGFGMSIFGLGGTLAFSSGPLAVTSFVVLLGSERLPWLSLMGLAVIFVLMAVVPAPAKRAHNQNGLFRELRDNLGASWRAVMVIWLVASLRSLADVSIRSFYPILLVEKGGSLLSVGAVLSLYTIGGAVSALVCGNLADRRGYKPIYYTSFVLAAPTLLWFIYSKGYWVYPISFITGFVLLATMFPSVALATKIAPRNKALASSITLGFAVGTGGIMTPLVGRLSEHFGLMPVLAAMALIPALCLLVIPYIPEYRANNP